MSSLPQRLLLKDGDFEERDGPALRYLLHRNPHGSTWGEMKLYLASQVRLNRFIGSRNIAGVSESGW